MSFVFGVQFGFMFLIVMAVCFFGGIAITALAIQKECPQAWALIEECAKENKKNNEEPKVVVTND